MILLTPIEFLSNKNKMFDFFTIYDNLVIFDTLGYLNVVYSIPRSDYERVYDSFILGCVPNLYSYLDLPYFLY